MRYEPFAEQKIDAVIGARVFNLSWLITNAGVAVLQMWLLAQAWQQSHMAAWTACIAGCWLLGSLLAARLDPRSPVATRLLGIGFAACALLWLRIPGSAAPSLTAAQGQPMSVPGMVEMAIIALLLGALSAAWLAQRRPWPPVDERVALGRGLCGTVLGLCVAWMVPAWASTIGLLCLAPLLVIDCWPQAQCPLPAPGNLLDSWYDSYGLVNRRRWRLNRRELPRGWWWSYLAQRRRLFLTLLGSSAAIMLGAIWAVVPTPFAAGLAANHAAGTLGWLVIGQAVALVCGIACFNTLRDVLGPPDRLIPPRWQPWAWSCALGALAMVAACLLALGWPTLQTAWSLAASITLYTFAAAVWGILLPRLKPGLATVISAQRHIVIRQTGALLDKNQLAYEQAQEDYASRMLATFEGLLTLFIVPCLGWYVDQVGVDAVLLAAGRFMFIFVVLACLGYGLARVWRGRQRNAGRNYA